MAGWFFVLFVGFMLPAGVLKQYIKPREGPDPDDPPSRSKLIRQTILTLVFIGLLAVAATETEGVHLFGVYHFREVDFFAGEIAFFSFFALRAILSRWIVKDPRRKQSRVVPKTWAQFPIWILVSASAGFWEEIIFRGALYQFLVRYSNSIAFAFGFTCLVFAVVHLKQGLRSGLFILFLAAGIQWLVAFTGTLYVAMVVHFLYDLLVGVTVILAEKRKAAVSE